MDVPTLAFTAAWVLKPVSYWAIFAFAQRRWVASESQRRWRPFAAASARLAMGVLVGVPAGVLLADAHADAVVVPVFSVLRAALWAAALWIFFRGRVSWNEAALLIVAAVAFNWVLDFGTGEGGWWPDGVRHFRLC